MRPALIALLALALLPRPGHADPLDNFSVVGNGQDFEFFLPASTTGPDFDFSPAYGFAPVSGSVNGTPMTLDVGIDFPGAYVTADTFIVSDVFGYTELGLPSLYSLTFDPSAQTGTLSFVPGTYPTAEENTILNGYVPYSITITPEASSPTPEPPSLLLLATGLAGLLFLWRSHRPAQPMVPSTHST